MQPTPQPSSSRRTVRGGDVELSVVEVGHPDAPAAVIAHGVGSSARFVTDAFAEAIVGAGFRLVTFDLRGHGRSGPARDPDHHTLERHAGDLAAVAEAAGADAGVALIGGVSLGAHAAAAVCADPTVVEAGDVQDGVDDPGSPALVACLPAWSGRAEPGAGPHAAIAAEIREVGVPRALERASRDPSVPPWLGELLRRDWTAADRRSLEAALLALDGGRAPTVEELRSLRVPTVVVAWPDDPGHPLHVAEAWERHVPHAVLEITSMEAVGRHVGALGEAAVRGLGRLGRERPAERDS